MGRGGRPGRAWSKQKAGLPEHRAPRLTDLEACREAWAVGNPDALRQGIELCANAGGLPQWLADGLKKLVKSTQRRLWQRYRTDLRHFVRFAEVRAARRRGLTWQLAYESAAKALEQTPAFGGPEAMASSYKRVKKTAATASGRYAR